MGKHSSVPLETIRLYLHYHLLWPEKDSEFDPGKSFYLKFTLLQLSTTIVFFSNIAHIIVALQGTTDAVLLDSDVSITVSNIGIYYFLFAYLACVKDVAKAIRNLSDTETFDKPDGFDVFNENMNKVVKWVYVYIIIIIIGLGAIPFLERNRCIQRNIERGIHEFCGVMAQVWFPFDIDYFPLRQLYYLIQAYSAYFSSGIVMIIMLSVCETIEYVIFRIKHVNKLFADAINENSHEARRKSFNKSVQYHNFILSTAEQLGEAYSNCNLLHLVFTSFILAALTYQIQKNVHISDVALLVAWFVGLCVISLEGQRLMDACESVGEEIYNVPWYNVEIDIQKDLILVMLRATKPCTLKRGPFGVLCYTLLLSVLKTAYSILSVIKATE